MSHSIPTVSAPAYRRARLAVATALSALSTLSNLFALPILVVLLAPLASRPASAAILPFAPSAPRVQGSFDEALRLTWQGIKRRNIDAYAIPLVHRPKSELPHDAVSEGVGYGMLCALYADDQAYFDKIWDAGERYMWAGAGSFYNWRVDEKGGNSGEYWTGPASDADQDIALALIFADRLVAAGHWKPHTSPKGATYAQRASTILETFWNTMVEDGKYLKPGHWGGKGALNPGYFAPAFYRVFDAFDGSSGRNWNAFIDQCYATLAATPGASRGLTPDWSNSDGGLLSEGPGYNAYEKGQAMYKDGIRTLWRLATDYLWYREPRAKAFLIRAMAFVDTPGRANFYKLDGSPVPAEFELGNGATRPRSEHSHLTVGMWAAAALGAGDTARAEAFAAELRRFHTPGADFWGKASDPAGEDTLRNEMYFDQFLAWYGAATLGGVFTNLWEDLQDPDPRTPLSWKSAPVLAGLVVDGGASPMRLQGALVKPALWIVSVQNTAGAPVVRISGKSDTIKAEWYGVDGEGRPMPPGEYRVRVEVPGLPPGPEFPVWLGRALDLRQKGALLVDDFRDGDTRPYLGAWGSYLDSHDGKAGKSALKAFAVTGTDAARHLDWTVVLNEGGLGFNPYAALAWSVPQTPAGGSGLNGLQEIRLEARSPVELRVSVQLVTSDVTDHNFFEDSLVLRADWKTHALPLKDFRPRWGGDRKLDLGKLTAVRFQVQLPTGTQATIQLRRLELLGAPEAFYSSPPALVPAPPGFGATAIRQASRQNPKPETGPPWIRILGFPGSSGTTDGSVRDALGRSAIVPAFP